MHLKYLLRYYIILVVASTEYAELCASLDKGSQISVILLQ
jgi:hypothetical protein